MNRKEHNKQETIKHIKKTFIQLYGKKGLAGLSTNELCRVCGVSKTSFYTYFDDKYSLLETIEKELLYGLSAINSQLNDCDMAAVSKGLPLNKAEQTVSFIHSHISEFKAILGPHGDIRFETMWKKDIESSFISKFRMEKGSERASGIACTIFSSALIGLYRYYIFENSHITPAEFTIILGNTLKYALFDFM